MPSINSHAVVSYHLCETLRSGTEDANLIEGKRVLTCTVGRGRGSP